MRKYLFNPRVLIILSIIFYLISLFIPAIYIKIPSYESPEYWQPKEAYTGFMILMIGWFSLLSGLPAWLANISYFITLIFYDGHKPPIKSAYLTVLLALTSFFYIRFPADSGRYPEYVDYFGIGFYCWLLSFFLLVVACHRKMARVSEQ